MVASLASSAHARTMSLSKSEELRTLTELRSHLVLNVRFAINVVSHRQVTGRLANLTKLVFDQQNVLGVFHDWLLLFQII